MTARDLLAGMDRVNRVYANAVIAQHRAIRTADAVAFCDARTSIADLTAAWALLRGARPDEIGRNGEDLTEERAA